MASRHWLYFGGFAVSAILLVGVGLIGTLDALSVLSGGTAYSEELVVLAMLGEAAEWVVIGLALGLLAAAFLVASVVSILRNASVPRDDRLVSIVERLERKYPLLREFDVARKVEPTAEDRRRELKERYVAGEISEERFEREMAQLMDGGTADSSSRTGDGVAVELEDESSPSN